MPEDGSAPKGGKFACRTCKEWFASSTGRMGHVRKNPDHQLYSLLTGKESKPWAGENKRSKPGPKSRGLALSANGHSHLNASARDLLLDYILEKAKVDLNAELDRMFGDLKSQPIPVDRPTSRK